LSLLANPFSTVRQWFRGNGLAKADGQRSIDPGTRNSTYDLNAALYDNTLYQAYRDWVLTNFFPRCDKANASLVGHFNPIKEIVDIYVSNVLPGVWGDGIEVDPMVDGEPVNPLLPPIVRRIWRDSNLDSLKSLIVRYAANLGTVGLRITRTPESIPGDRSTSRVRIQEDHPSRLFNIEEDGQGNVTGVVLKYEIQRNFGTITRPDYQPVEVIETITRDEFSRIIGGKESLADAQRVNRYGFCPYVIARHRDNGTQYGDWSYKGSEPVIHAINFRISQQDRSIGRHMFPKWFLAASGDKPSDIDVGGDKASYVKLPLDAPPPLLEAIVAKIDFPASLSIIGAEMKWMARRQPEMAVGDLELFANLSGESMSQALKKAESAIRDVRPGYDHAFIRAIQMGMSIGMTDALPDFDVGAGTGEGSGDRAFNEGLETFQFKPRPALPQTPVQVKAQADAGVADQVARFTASKQAQAIGVDTQTALEIAGFDKKQIAEIRVRKGGQDTIPTEPL
jgi:hypothetical protein